MLILVMATLFFTASIYLALYQFRAKIFGLHGTHLPAQMFDNDSIDMGLSAKKYEKQQDSAWSLVAQRTKSLEKYISIPAAGFKKRLIKAGSPIGVVEFFAFKVFALIFIPLASFILLADKFPKNIVLTVSLAIGFFLPELWLNKKIRARHSRIRKDLPNIIDLLTLCVSGGVDFMLAVNRVVKDLKTCDLTKELSEVYRETQMGKPKREALKNFASRVDMPEIHSFVRTLVQADRMGTPMAEALNMQAEEIRVRRFQQGEAMALKAPIKLLFPLFAFILPVVLIIVGGPIMLQFIRGGTNFGF